MEYEPTVFIVDDDQGVRDGLGILVSSVGHRTKSFSSAQAFLDNYDPAWPGCLVLDIRMPGISGLDLQDQLRAEGINLPVIIITGHGDVPACARAMKAGAVDFLEKPVNDQAFLDRIARAVERDARNRRKDAASAKVRERLGQLTPREREVMQRLVIGMSDKQIALELGISFQAVAARRNKILRKTGTRNVVELTRQALTSANVVE